VPVRVKIAVPLEGLGGRLGQIIVWLDAKLRCRWVDLDPSTTRGVVSDALAVYFVDARMRERLRGPLARGAHGRDRGWGLSGQGGRADAVDRREIADGNPDKIPRMGPAGIRHPSFFAHPPLSTRAASSATLGPGPGEPPWSYGAVDRSINSRDPFSEGHRVRFPRHQVVEASVASVTSPAWSRPRCS
jgi:hypothetical protein